MTKSDAKSLTSAANQRYYAAKRELAEAEHGLKVTKNQIRCKHKNVDMPGSLFGETCTACGLFLNNSAF